MSDDPDHLTSTAAGAQALDDVDPLAEVRHHFQVPPGPDGEPQCYMVGNSLGLAPTAAGEALTQEFERWSTLGVAGHTTGETAWAEIHHMVAPALGAIVGALDEEVAAMNSLTANLHFLMVSFYQPTKKRHKILAESHAFPSDHFAIESQIRQRGFDPAESMVLVSPRPGEHTLRPEDIIAAIEDNASELALVLLPGVHYYTGQVLPLAEISTAAHNAGAMVGFDLAHAVGNIKLDLHAWDVDFAAWCTYKYLNAGPGSVGGAYVNQKHLNDQTIPKFLGWWGTNRATRFEMKTVFDPILTIDSWQVSNANVWSIATLGASLKVFDEVGGMDVLRAKSEQQIAYLDYLLADILGDRVQSITPTDIDQRGCQFSLQIDIGNGHQVHDQLIADGVACDWRYPNVIRVAPVPLYNSYSDIHRLVAALDKLTASSPSRTLPTERG